MKRVLVPAALLLMVWMSIGRAQSPDPLDAQVLLPQRYDTFDEAMTRLEKATGLKIAYPNDTAQLMRAVWKRGEMPQTVQDDWLKSPQPARRLLDEVCGDLALSWKFNPQNQTVMVDLPWRRADPRSTAELFQIVWQPGHEAEIGKLESWWEALDGLLSKPENIGSAGPAQQTARFASMWRLLSEPKAKWWPPSETLWEQPVIAASGEHFLCLFLVHGMEMSPGHGWMSYYWFKEDGTLAGAGVMNTGHRQIVDEIKVNAQGRFGERPSEMSMTVRHNNNGTPRTVQFVLGKKGFELADESGLGESLIEPVK
ncbi:MAG: hypothetical protein P4L99_20045 [Chthoniobacter sp.]|nr:hypothetical protein [Chthoniobacter sp.]